ncbi:MAG: DUF1127 domain-containing protein [Pseudomonadota bacterium]
MAHIIQTAQSYTNPFSNLVLRLRDAYAKRATYNKVLRELSSMSNRELTDINLCRGDIRRVAREAMDL